MRKTFRYRIYASEQTIIKTNKWLELCRELYNSALAERIYAWKMQRHNITRLEQQYEIPAIRMAIPEYQNINAQVLRSPLFMLDFAFKSFYSKYKRGVKCGLPRFKGFNRYHSFTLYQNGWHLDGRYLWVNGLGRFKMALSREIKGNIRTIGIKRTPTNKWYATFNCDNVPENKLEVNNGSIGLDMGVSYYITDSDGNKTENPKHLDKSLKQLRIRNRKLAKSKKGSNRRKRTKLLVAKTHERVFNQRLDFLHKLANYYVKNYGTIAIEDLAIKNMVQNHKLAQSISDCAWGKFFELLKYKAEEAGRTIIENYRFEPTSKVCNDCGEINHKLKLSDRQWVCLKCGTLHDRDINAAKNILEVGLGRTFRQQRSSIEHA